MDFYDLAIKESTRPPVSHIYPDFKYAYVKDLVAKGGSMYAFWNEDHWETSLDAMVTKVDKHIYERVEAEKLKQPGKTIKGSYLNSNVTQLMKQFDQYVKLVTPSTAEFNTKIIFADAVVKRSDYATTQLNYTPMPGVTPAFDELLGLLYSSTELDKILWFMGALLTNNMANIQKFMYLYGSKGSGKGTVLKIIKMMFEGYYSPIDLMHLTSGSEFATSQIKEVPLLIDDDSDISRIKNDTILLKLTAHEPVSVNAKHKQIYDITFKGLMITASNQRFKVRNIDSGITRRAIVVEPTSKKHNSKDYMNLMSRVKYEIPMIAQKAIDLFETHGPYYYENYMDVSMVEATDHIFSFVREHSVALGDPCSLRQASEIYKVYLDDLGFDTKGYKRKIKNELSRYYMEFYVDKMIDGEKYKNVFVGFRRDVAFPDSQLTAPSQIEPDGVDWAVEGTDSTFDIIASAYPAQPATASGVPSVAWDDCTTTLADVDTTKLHYVRVPLNHIVIDFDMKGPDGEKDLAENLLASQKFPDTYTELSKSGKGVHLHYIYDGDVAQLAKLYADDVEIKVFTGKQSLRRLLTKYNSLPLTRITTGLPTKEKDGVTVYKDVEIITWNEKKIRTAIKGNLEKQYHDSTKPSMDFIKHIFEQAEKEGIKYDLRDMRQDILSFATKSSNNIAYCVKVANDITYCTIDDVIDTPKLQSGTVIYKNEDLVFYDIEVYPNLFVVVWKKYGKDQPQVRWVNPTPKQIEELVEYPLIGFNNRRYDNHIIYSRMIGENVLALYRQSQRIINKDGASGMYGGAYELSYADIYDYTTKKQGLKKWEIELGIKHDEMELPWDQPVPEELWPRILEYCGNDVDATEAVFNHTFADYTARLIVAELSGLKVNATTTQHAAAFLFGDDPRPQDKFNYVDLGTIFEGYTNSFGKSEYRGEDPLEGGYVYSEPGIYHNVALIDAESMHPTSLVEMNYFGPYTALYKELLSTRLAIKHGDWGTARTAFNGRLLPYLEDNKTAKDLSFALKIIINIVYGMTSASFDNKFRHPLNRDNVVAKRGALFMIDLKHAVQDRGFKVAHIKTDSIKIPDATPEIIEFVVSFGKKYGYNMDHEETYKRMALVNKAVYIAEYHDKDKGKDVWSATGSQFAEPVVYKTLFTRDELVEDDYFTTKTATAPIYLGETFVGKSAQVYASLTGQEMTRVTEEKVGAISGTKGFLWKLASEYKDKEDLNMEYYDGLVKKAVKAIEGVGDLYAILDPFEKDTKPSWLEGDPLPF